MSQQYTAYEDIFERSRQITRSAQLKVIFALVFSRSILSSIQYFSLCIFLTLVLIEPSCSQLSRLSGFSDLNYWSCLRAFIFVIFSIFLSHYYVALKLKHYAIMKPAYYIYTSKSLDYSYMTLYLLCKDEVKISAIGVFIY